MRGEVAGEFRGKRVEPLAGRRLHQVLSAPAWDKRRTVALANEALDRRHGPAGRPPFSAHRERHRGHHQNTQKKDLESNVKEKRKAGTRAGLTKAAIVAAAAKLIESVGANGFSLRKLAEAHSRRRSATLSSAKTARQFDTWLALSGALAAALAPISRPFVARSCSGRGCRRRSVHAAGGRIDRPPRQALRARSHLDHALAARVGDGAVTEARPVSPRSRRTS